jgi:hypothetical protein
MALIHSGGIGTGVANAATREQQRSVHTAIETSSVQYSTVQNGTELQKLLGLGIFHEVCFYRQKILNEFETLF